MTTKLIRFDWREFRKDQLQRPIKKVILNPKDEKGEKSEQSENFIYFSEPMPKQNNKNIQLESSHWLLSFRLLPSLVQSDSLHYVDSLTFKCKQ